MNSFKDNYYRTYSVKIWTFENMFCIFIYYLIFAVPFYVSFSGANFWLQSKFDQFTVKYRYTGYYALQVVFFQGIIIKRQFANIPYSSLSGVIDHTMNVQDFAGNASFKLQLKGFAKRAIQSINGILYYDVEIAQINKIVSCGYAFSVEGDISTSNISGIISLSASQPIDALTEIEAKTINQPIYYTRNYKGATTFIQLVSSQINSPYMLEGIKDSVSIFGTTDTRTFTLNLFKQQNIILPFYPSILETFKFKYSTYFGFLLLSYMIFRGLMIALIEEEGLQCNIKDEKPPSQSRS